MIELDTTYLIVLGILFIPMIMAIIRVIKGPTAPDRVVGLDTINTIVIVGMVIFSLTTKPISVIYIDVAIVYALLSFISTLFIAKYLEGGEL